MICSLFCVFALLFSIPLAQAAPQAVSIAVGGDNLTRLLWNNPDGSTSLWKLNADGTVAAQTPYGPFSGWTAQTLAVGANSAPRFFWNNTNGQTSLWNTTDPNPSTSCLVYGPYSGWNASALAVGGSNAARLLWNNVSGQVSLWNLTDANPPATGVTYGPYSGWSGKTIAAGADSRVRILWDNADGRVSVWNQSDANPDATCLVYGPHSGWSGKALAVGANNVARLLWLNTSGQVSLWNLTDANPSATCFIYTPPAGYTAAGMAVGTDNLVRLLWSGTDGTAQVWTIAAGGTYTAKTYPQANGIALTSLVVSPASVTGGGSSMGTVTLSSAAPVGGVNIGLTSSSASASIPASVTVAAGAVSVAFSITTTAVTASTPATITASYNGASKSATLTVNMPAFQITNIKNGDVLSGDVVVNISVLNGNSNGSQISLTVDGVTVDGGNVLAQSDGSYAETMVVETNNSSNGVHTIAAVDGLGNSDVRNVSFNNTVTNIVYDPIFDESSNAGGVSQASHFSAALATPQAWQSAIQDYNGNVVRSYNGSGSSIAVTWDGKDSQGNDVTAASYDLVVATTPLSSGATTPNAAGAPIHRPVAKDSIGDSLILIDQNALIGGAATGPAYAKFINGLVASKTGIDFTTKPVAILTTGANVALYPALRNRINYRLQIPCSLIYVYAHGSAVVKPRFQMGGWFWYPSLPLIAESGVPLNRRFDVSSFTAMAGYDNGNDPPRLVWMDNCDSSGINSLNPDNSWGNCFSVSQGGAYVGWAGPIKFYGYPQGSIYSCFTNWRDTFWTDLFQNNQNVQTALANANKTPGQSFGPNQNPSGLVTSYGFGSASF